MTARILDGKSIAMMLEETLAKQSAALEKRAGRKPGLFVVLVGDDPASAVYVRNKTRACARTRSERERVAKCAARTSAPQS